jgi:hypothetical protein
MLHYGTLQHQTDRSAEGEGNLEYLKSGRTFSKVEGVSVSEIKSHLREPVHVG